MLTGHYLYPNAKILVFAKAPVPGQVKTRLLPILNEREAANLHTKLVHETLILTHQQPLCPVQLWCSPVLDHPLFQDLGGKFPLSFHLQQGDDLGERMQHALSTALKSCKFAILIGCDCPSLSSDDLHSVLSSLQNGCDVVLGPAEDGGYVLIGVNSVVHDLFSNISWSTSTVLTETRTRVTQLGLSCEELALQWDIDRPEDLHRYLLQQRASL